MSSQAPEMKNPSRASSPADAYARLPAKKWLLGGGALAIAVFAFWHLTHNEDSRNAAQRRGGGGAPVRVAGVTQRDMPVTEHTIGKVIANTMVQVTARVQGVLDSAHFKEGQFVKKGDLLFQIDPRGYQASLDQAKAILARDQAQLKNALRDKQRYETLRDKGNVSAQQLDLSSTNAEVLVATVAADQAALQLAELNLGYTQIRSPVDGKTGPLLIQPGNLIAAGGTTPLVMIAQMQPIKVSFTLPETDLARIRARQRTSGLKANLDVADDKGTPLQAGVDFTDNAVNAQSGTIELRATFANGDLSLIPGQLVNINVELDNIKNALVVPRDAISDGPNGSYVYEVQDGKAVQHSVKILFDDTKSVAVEGDIGPLPIDQQCVAGLHRTDLAETLHDDGAADIG